MTATVVRTGRVTGPEEAGRLLLEPATYTDEPLLWEACAILREQAPLSLVEHPAFQPVYVAARHADVLAISKDNKVWIQGQPQSLKSRAELAAMREMKFPPLRFLVSMDGAEHRAYRNLTASWFLPRNLARLDARLAELAQQSADELLAAGGTCDAAAVVAIPFPMRVILALLGLPEEDYALMLKLTQQMLGPADPEFAAFEDATPAQTWIDSIERFYEYFLAVKADRRANPRDDLATLIATAEIPSLGMSELPLAEVIGYYVVFAVAGHDTAASSIAAGIRALAEHPDQFARLQADPSLIPAAAEEIIRWASPARHFLRVAAEPTNVAGVAFEPGDTVFLSYPSANRDEAAFKRPELFDVGRNPNPHLAFGHGPHHCLGAQLARMEVRALLTELVPRLGALELAGTPELAASIMAGGHKHLPISYELSAAH